MLYLWKSGENLSTKLRGLLGIIVGMRGKGKKPRLAARRLAIKFDATKRAAYNWEAEKARAREKKRRKLDEFFRNKATVGEHIG